VEDLSHAAESVLDGLRRGTLEISSNLIDLLLQAGDCLGRMVENPEAQQSAEARKIAERLTLAPSGPSSTGTMIAEHTLSPIQLPDHGSAGALPADPDRDRTIRIPVEVADRLMTLASELVLVRNQALKKFEPRDSSERELVQRLNMVTSEIQRSVTETRMQPVGNLFQRFPRVARDIARQLGKSIELAISGTEVELDKGVIEKLADPLTHLIRNACDHGIENPADRLKAGKPATGSIRLEAHHEGNQIHVVVRDDGAGIDPARVGRKAVERGLLGRDEAAGMTPSQLQMFVLKPGFSTADKVTDLSGRGVGLDVVQANLAAIGGKLEIDSEPGRGTKFRLQLPLTLAIIPCLVVEAGGHRLCVAQRDLEELVLLDGASRQRIEVSHDRLVYRLRDQLLPVLRLGEWLGAAAPAAGEPRFLAVVRAGPGRLGVVIDNVRNPEEIVVKPLHPALESIGLFSGATVLGDGLVSLILDMDKLARRSGTNLLVAVASSEKVSDVARKLHLVFEDHSGGRFSAPLDSIRKVVRFGAGQATPVGGRASLSHADEISPMVGLAEVVPGLPRGEKPDSGYLLLPKGKFPRNAGFVVADIIDTVEEPRLRQAPPLKGPGVTGAAEIRVRSEQAGKLTLMLDPLALADAWEGAA
jgi:two-component system chemotaxis sensor kinase CheA